MCGRYVITSPPAAMRAVFGYAEQAEFPPRYNVAPGQPIPVVTGGRLRRFMLMRWGLIPSWVKDPRGFALLINARAETVNEKPAFMNAMKRRRCLVPADGFYEWRAEGRIKQPYFIAPMQGGPIAFAGLWETWTGPNGEELDTVALITVPSRHELVALHARQPAVIAPARFERWLDCDGVDAAAAAALLGAPAPGFFACHAVSRAVNRAAADDPALILPVAEGAGSSQHLAGIEDADGIQRLL